MASARTGDASRREAGWERESGGNRVKLKESIARNDVEVVGARLLGAVDADGQQLRLPQGRAGLPRLGVGPSDRFVLREEVVVRTPEDGNWKYKIGLQAPISIISMITRCAHRTAPEGWCMAGMLVG